MPPLPVVVKDQDANNHVRRRKCQVSTWERLSSKYKNEFWNQCLFAIKTTAMEALDQTKTKPKKGWIVAECEEALSRQFRDVWHMIRARNHGERGINLSYMGWIISTIIDKGYKNNSSLGKRLQASKKDLTGDPSYPFLNRLIPNF